MARLALVAPRSWGTDGTIQALSQIGAGYTMTTRQGTITGTAGLGLTGCLPSIRYSAMAAPIYNGQGIATFLQQTSRSSVTAVTCSQ
jgi:hypothetical protein